MAKLKQGQSDKNQSNTEEILTDSQENYPVSDENSKDAANIAGITAILEERCRSLDEINDKYKRLSADFDNFRRRTIKEKEEIGAFVTEKIVCELLSVMDNFERAVDMSTSSDDAAGLKLGIEMIFRQFGAVLTRLGVEPIEAVDCQFDPAQHEAVARVTDDDKPEGTIVSQVQKGYKLKGRIIRPSMVNVVGN